MLPLMELCSIFLDSCGLLGSHLKEKGKGILGVREGWGAHKEGGIQNSFKLKYVSFFQITIHTDTLNESACVEQSIAAFKVYY